MFDVDLDVSPSLHKEPYGVQAVIYDKENKVLRKHNSGRYFRTNMPVDGVTGMAAIDYKEAEADGFVKLDMLNNTSMNNFSSMEEYLTCVSTSPDWEMLYNDPDEVAKIPHIGNHFWILRKVKPTSIIELADILALIRPAKINLVDAYVADREAVRKILYIKDEKYYYKKSHAVAYAHLIVAFMNSTEKKAIEAFVTLR